MPFTEGTEITHDDGSISYPCSNCGFHHTALSQAVSCCHFTCAECGAGYRYETEALACHGHSCQYCGTYYATMDEAEECHSDMHPCPNCGSWYDEPERAERCCNPYHDITYPEEVLNQQPEYVLYVQDLPDRPGRPSSIEQELSSGQRTVAKMLGDMGVSPFYDIRSYGTDPGQRQICVKEDSSLPDDGGEVLYSRWRLWRAAEAKTLSKAVGAIRRLKDESLVSTTTEAGTHIHIGAIDHTARKIFGPAQVAALWEIFSFCEEVLFHLAAVGWKAHRGTSHTRPLFKLNKPKAGQIARRQAGHDNRYFSINYQRLFQAAQSCTCGACPTGDWEDCECDTLSKGTIEWRIFNASTKPETLHAWLLLAHALVAKAFDHELGTLEPNGWEGTDKAWHPWIFGWILNECPFTDAERQILIDCARRSETLQIDWEDFDRWHDRYEDLKMAPQATTADEVSQLLNSDQVDSVTSAIQNLNWTINTTQWTTINNTLIDDFDSSDALEDPAF